MHQYQCSLTSQSVIVFIVLLTTSYRALHSQVIQHENQTYRILSPSFNYNSRGSYLNLAFFHVEQRQRVLRMDFQYGERL